MVLRVIIIDERPLRSMRLRHAISADKGTHLVGAFRTFQDAGPVLRLGRPDVVIAEGGGAERSVDEYAGRHMPADMAFTAAVDFSLKKRDVIVADNLATVISQSQIHGTFRDQNVHSRMMETMVLRRDDDRWRIVHIHWSSAPITGEHEH